MDNEKLLKVISRLDGSGSSAKNERRLMNLLSIIHRRRVEIVCGRLYVDDHRLIGGYHQKRLKVLFEQGYIGSLNNRVLLTEAGKEKLEEPVLSTTCDTLKKKQKA